MRTTYFVALAVPLAIGASGVGAQTGTKAGAPMAGMATDAAPAPCPATPAPLPADLTGWSAATPVTAATATSGLALATLQPGHGALATLSPGEKVAYPVAPGHPGEPGTSGGLFAFAVTQAGGYRVALGSGAWVEVVKDGRAVASTAHGHGPACGTIRKTVAYTLAPGRYLLEISDNRAPTLALMVAPVRP